MACFLMVTRSFRKRQRSPHFDMPYSLLNAGVASPAMYRATSSARSWGESRRCSVRVGTAFSPAGTESGLMRREFQASLARSPAVGGVRADLFEYLSTGCTNGLPISPYSNICSANTGPDPGITCTDAMQTRFLIRNPRSCPIRHRPVVGHAIPERNGQRAKCLSGTPATVQTPYGVKVGDYRTPLSALSANSSV